MGKRVLILVDIEGAEYLMLKGATNVLKSTPPPIWMIEITYSENQPKKFGKNPNYQKTFDMFFDNGYKAYTADKNNKPITRDEIRNIIKGNTKPPAYNFIFSIDSIYINKNKCI